MVHVLSHPSGDAGQTAALKVRCSREPSRRDACQRKVGSEGFTQGERPQEEECSRALQLLMARQRGGGSGKGCQAGGARTVGRKSAEGGASDARGRKEDLEF